MYMALIEQAVIDSIIKVKPELNSGDIHDENILDADLGFDSLDAVEFVCQLEKELSITIPDEMIDKIKCSSVRDVEDMLLKLKQA
jgi:acyl carrier protein